MAESNDQLILDVKLGLDEVNKQLSTLKTQMQKEGEAAGESLSDGVNKGASGVVKIVAAIAATAASIAGAFSLSKAIGEASEAQQALNRLNIALASAGNFSEASSQGIQKFAEELSAVTTFSDDAIIASAALIENMAKLDTESLKAATSAAADLAAARQIPIEAASDAIAKAALGNTTALQKLGFEFTKGATDAQKFEQALKQIQDRFGGQAEAQTNTYAGAMAQLRNSINNVFEEFGNIIIQNPTVIALIKAMSGVFLNLKNIINENSGAISEYVSGAVRNFSSFINVVRNLLNFVYSAVSSVKDFFNAFSQSQAFDLFIAKAQVLGRVVLGGLAIAFDYVKEAAKETAEFFARVFSPIFSWLSENIQKFVTFVGSTVGESTVFKNVVENLSTEGDKVISETQRIAEGIKSALVSEDTGKTPFDTLFAPLSQENLDALVSRFAMAGEQFNNKSKEIGNTASQVAKDMTFEFNNRIANGIANVVQGMTRALMTGQNAFKALGGMILNVLGDLAIQLGTFLISAGLGIQALMMNPLTAGFAAVAAGIALVALGGILKTFGSQGSLAGVEGMGGGNSLSGAAGPQDNFSGAPFQQNQQQQQQSQVVVNIQGNVLDRRETGLEIANVIRESFEQEGVSIVTA